MHSRPETPTTRNAMERSRVDRRVSCRAWKRAIVVAIGLSSVASTAVAATTADLTGQRVQVVYRDSGGATEQMSEGDVLVEALDGGLLIEEADGQLRLIEADWRERVDPLPETAPATPTEVGRQVLAELPEGFQLLTTRHYCICFDTSRDYASWVGSVFERLHQAFGTYFRREKLDISRPKRPLVVVIFADRSRYQAHAEPTLGTASPNVVGYYNLMSNRVITYDITGSDLLRERLVQRPSVGQAIAASPAASALVSTLVHEATHQLAFNTGLHQRLAPIPVWLSEGVAMYFETPDLQATSGWRGIGMLNHQRFERWRQVHRRELLSRIIVDDDVFRDPVTALDAYAEAWGLAFFLLKTQRREAADYLARLGSRGPLTSDSPEQRLADFEAAFGGDVESLEPELVRFFARQR
jgi:hypothetical protein